MGYSIYSEISMTREKHNGAIFLASLGRPRKMSYACRGKISIKVILGRFFWICLVFKRAMLKITDAYLWVNTVFVASEVGNLDMEAKTRKIVFSGKKLMLAANKAHLEAAQNCRGIIQNSRGITFMLHPRWMWSYSQQVPLWKILALFISISGSFVQDIASESSNESSSSNQWWLAARLLLKMLLNQTCLMLL